ncbi:uncharacterized protein TrAFT101_007038 [Trichoderma asperellum]|uniref:uncharacterized protein n=1 Tax=Trichoderma asperellum TaxID=101201 RepID=UPI0033309402|nr:hypothetical protein TrAFT101_007038 [Trichoderma asperellum]
MPISATASRYKRTYHPPVNYKNAGLRSEVRGKAPGTPYAYQQLKKLNDLHALKNPDWRNRPSDNSSSAANDSEHNIPEVVGAGEQRIGMDASPPTPRSAAQGKRETESQQFISSSQDGAAASNTLRYSQNDIFAISSRMEQRMLKTLEEEKPAQYEVLKQLSLSSSIEHPLNLFEVAPLGSTPSYSTKTVVDIRPLRGSFEQRKQGASSNSQDEQLTAALRAADATPLRVRAHVYQARGPYTISDERRARKGFSETHEAYESQSNKTHTHTNERQLSKSDRPANDTGPATKIEIERDEAFQRFLNKLGQNSKGFQRKRAQEQSRMDSGYDDGVKESLRESPVETSTQRHRAHGADLRKKPNSELLNNSHARGTETHHQKDGSSNSADSGVFPNMSSKFRNFNPKAREFLSFALCTESSPEEGNMEPLQPFPALFTQKDGQANVASLAELAPLTDISSVQPPPPYGFVPFAAANGATDPLTLNNLMARRFIPVSADQFGGSLQAPAIPLQPLSLVTPAMFQPQPVLQAAPGNIMGFQAPNLMNTAFPLTTSSANAYFNMPSGQMSLMGAAPPHPPQPQPHPVPKPRRPDPRDQQAYEAWIEWRKANQPGYAYECRLRQQRRAQRSSEEKVPGRVTVGHKSEPLPHRETC